MLKSTITAILLLTSVSVACNPISHTVKEDMMLVEGGGYWRGVEGGEDNPRQYIEVDSFHLAKKEVTLKEFREFLAEVYPNSDLMDDSYVLQDTNAGPAYVASTDIPMVRVTFFEALEYCNWLSEKMNLTPVYSIQFGEEKRKYIDIKVEWDDGANGYRLPTEAEWEYAARAGTDRLYEKGFDRNAMDEIAWFEENSKSSIPEAVGSKAPNLWGFYDMLGSASEWCRDLYDVDYYNYCSGKNPKGPDIGNNPYNEFELSHINRVLRGGDKDFSYSWLGVEVRVGAPPGSRRFGFTGFRLAANK